MTPTLHQLTEQKVTSIGYELLQTLLDIWLTDQGFVYHSRNLYNLEPANLGFQALIQLNAANLIMTVRVKQPNSHTAYHIQYIKPLDYSMTYPEITAHIYEVVSRHISYCTH